jgi:hypothetical protein
MATGDVRTDRRAVIGGTLGAFAVAGLAPAAAAPPVDAEKTETIRKASPMRGSFGILQPGIKRTAFLNAPAGMDAPAFQQHWLDTYADGLGRRGARKAIFNRIDKEHSPEKRFDAVVEIFFASDRAYEQAYLKGRTAYTDEADETKPSLVLMTREFGIRDFDPGRPVPAVKRFGVVRRKPELTPETLALAWRDDHAPLFAANAYLRRYYVNLTDRTYAPDVPWDGYADIWWDNHASVPLHSDTRVPLPESDAAEVMYMFMTPKTVV